jgi:hypothetical protein
MAPPQPEPEPQPEPDREAQFNYCIDHYILLSEPQQREITRIYDDAMTDKFDGFYLANPDSDPDKVPWAREMWSLSETWPYMDGPTMDYIWTAMRIYMVSPCPSSPPLARLFHCI